MQRNRPYGASEFASGVACVLTVVVVIAALTIACIHGCATQEETAEEPEEPAAVVLIDTSDSWDMHTLGLPTKSDIMAYHMYGRWGFVRYDEGEQIQTTHIWEDVPGSIEAWDALYGIDSENKAFNYPKE